MPEIKVFMHHGTDVSPHTVSLHPLDAQLIVSLEPQRLYPRLILVHDA